MSITLDNFRAQIGNQNHGAVIADQTTGGLKTINNGWFARHFTKVFGTKTTAAQNQDAAVKLFRAVKLNVAGGNAEETNLFLQGIAARLGLQVNGEQVTATRATPLSRRTIKDVVMTTDKFKLQLLNGIRRAADDLVMEMAGNLARQLNDEAATEIVGREEVRFGNKTIIRAVYGHPAGFVPYPPPLNAEHGLQFLKDCRDQDLIRGHERRSEINMLINDRQKLAALNPEEFAETKAMAKALEQDLGNRRLRNMCGRVATGAEYLEETIWKDPVLLKYFREEMGCQLHARAYTLKIETWGDIDDYPVEALHRIVHRQFEKVIAQLANEPSFTRNSMADKTKDLAALCVSTMSNKEFMLAMGVPLTVNAEARPGHRAA